MARFVRFKFIKSRQSQLKSNDPKQNSKTENDSPKRDTQKELLTKRSFKKSEQAPANPNFSKNRENVEQIQAKLGKEKMSLKKTKRDEKETLEIVGMKQKLKKYLEELNRFARFDRKLLGKKKLIRRRRRHLREYFRNQTKGGPHFPKEAKRVLRKKALHQVILRKKRIPNERHPRKLEHRIAARLPDGVHHRKGQALFGQHDRHGRLGQPPRRKYQIGPAIFGPVRQG